jgi:hypothetical protein
MLANLRRRLQHSGGTVLLIATGLLLAGPPSHANAATNIQALVAQATHNTNTVRTLIHHDTITISGSSLTVKVNANGAEDEVHNREQDHESVVVTGKTSKNQVKTIRYTADIIFMNNKTYYRVSLANNTWQSRSGMTFNDPYTGGWKRGRTTVSYPKGTTFKLVDTSAGQTHVRADISSSSQTGTVDLWISGGSKPYVVKEDQKLHTKTGKGTVHIITSFGPFDSVVLVQPPSSGAST